MSDKPTGRGVFPAVPFTFTYTYGTKDAEEVTWKGRGRYCAELSHQIEREKEDNDGVSVTEQALLARDPRKAEAAKLKADRARLREKRRAEREALAAARTERRKAREAKRAADRAAATQARSMEA